MYSGGQLEFISPQKEEQSAHPHQVARKKCLQLLHYYKCKIGLYSFGSFMKKMKKKKTKVCRCAVHVHSTNKPDISCFSFRWLLNWDRRQWRLYYKGKHKSSNLVKASQLQPLLDGLLFLSVLVVLVIVYRQDTQRSTQIQIWCCFKQNGCRRSVSSSVYLCNSSLITTPQLMS